MDATGQAIGAYGGWTSFGIAGLILAWLLLKHLPSKDDQFNNMVKSRDELAKELSNSHNSAITTIVLNQKETVAKVVTDHKSMMSDLMDKLIANDKERVSNMIANERERSTGQREMLQMVIEHCKNENQSRDERMSSSLDQITKASDDTREILEEVRDAILLLTGKREQGLIHNPQAQEPKKV